MENRFFYNKTETFIVVDIFNTKLLIFHFYANSTQKKNIVSTIITVIRITIDWFPMKITIKSIKHSDQNNQGSMTAKSETARRSTSEPVWLDERRKVPGGQVKCTVLASSLALSCLLISWSMQFKWPYWIATLPVKHEASVSQTDFFCHYGFNKYHL